MQKRMPKSIPSVVAKKRTNQVRGDVLNMFTIILYNKLHVGVAFRMPTVCNNMLLYDAV